MWNSLEKNQLIHKVTKDFFMVLEIYNYLKWEESYKLFGMRNFA